MYAVAESVTSLAYKSIVAPSVSVKLADIDKKLNTDISRANEDEIIKLRQYQRQYQTDLRGVQDNMAQRGLAISGIRMREETTTTDNYNDLTTTAQQEAQRIREDAETLADQSKRDLQLSTSFDLQDLLNQYSGQQKEAIQGAEGVLGTEKVSGILPEYTGVGDADLTSYQYGGVKGSYNTAYDTQKNDNFAAYEAKYGTSALINRFRGQLGTYKPVGGIIGTENVAKQRAPELNREVEQFISIVLDKKVKYNDLPKKPRILAAQIMGDARKMYRANIKGELDVEGFRNYMVALSALGGSLAGGLLGGLIGYYRRRGF